MSATYLFVIILSAGYVGSRFIFSRIRVTGKVRHLFLMGGEYILIGVLLGPSVSGIISREMILQLSPVIMVGIGWLGVLLGNQLAWRNLHRFSAEMHLLLLAENLIFFPLMGLLLWPLCWFVPECGRFAAGREFWLIVAALGATSPTSITILSHQLRLPMRFTLMPRFLSALDGVFAILVIGLVYGLTHPVSRVVYWSLGGWPWILIAGMLGILGGLFFSVLLKIARSENETVLAIMGIIIYTGGMALYLQLPALFIALLIGAVAANVSQEHARLSQILSATEKPFYIIFLIFAGALWRLDHWSVFLAAPAIFLLRLIGKWLATLIAARLVRPGSEVPGISGLTLSSLAGLALAIALEFALIFPGPVADWILGTFLVLVLINQIASPLILNQVLPRLRKP
ncbi:MAG TPA: hypothetical protein ENJ23_05075 [Bacteroidetes bacterium]|nr:hypothetical protein [Bacteroidota bacterium]